jgi:hypothetical protein
MARSRERSAASNGAGHDDERRLSPAARRLLWIVAYYAVVFAGGALAWRASPAVRELVVSDRLETLTGLGALSRSAATEPFTGAAPAPSDASAYWTPAARTLLALLGALATALPLAWVYSLARRRRGFDQAMVHTLILLPIAVAGMVVLVQNSLPLAFSLAGIVALLRFRNTLDDAKDGVYVFVATTIGISAAVGVLVVGIATSVVFNVVVLALWWVDFARVPTPGIRGGIRRLARLPDPGWPAAPLAVPGDGSPDGAVARRARAHTRTLGLTAEHRAIDPKGRFNTTLRVHTSDSAVAQPVVEQILGERSRRWELVGVMPGADERVVLKYLVQVRTGARGELLNAVRARGAAQVVGAEFK